MTVVPAGSAARGRAVRWAMLGTAGVVLAADQITKSLVLRLHPVLPSPYERERAPAVRRG